MGMSVNDSRLSELARMIGDWPGLVAGPPGELVEDSLVLLGHLEDARNLVDVGSGGGRYAIEVLGGSLEEVAPAPSTARRSGTVVVVRKIAPTPAAYPRRAGVPVRKPLEK